MLLFNFFFLSIISKYLFLNWTASIKAVTTTTLNLKDIDYLSDHVAKSNCLDITLIHQRFFQPHTRELEVPQVYISSQQANEMSSLHSEQEESLAPVVFLFLLSTNLSNPRDDFQFLIPAAFRQ